MIKKRFVMNKILKQVFIALVSVYLSLSCARAVSVQEEGWRSKKFFKIEYIKNRPVFISPDGKPFFAVSMVYAYGPEAGPNKGNMTAEKVLKELEVMKSHGFNTVDLYGDLFLREMLEWCEKNEMGIYFRTSYTNLDDFPNELRNFPDFMDSEFREKTKEYYTDFLALIKDYRCVLAVDMDQRWLFDISWTGDKRFDIPKLGPEGVSYLPIWLEKRYKDIKALNKLWKKKYADFPDILNDTEIIKDGAVEPLDNHPWRVDLVEYTNWTVNDFLLELTGYMRLLDPNHMITYTTELPEPIPFPLSTKENSGIDFISPVHYNCDSDFNRDWVANGEMFFMTKFHYDLQTLPVYINETGFRTSPLSSNPPLMSYASAKPGDEKHVAELYLEQTALMNTYPWLLGWAWFKWYDKLYEGDFGYIRDDGSLKPVSELGKVVNAELPVNMNAEPDPDIYIYYPQYVQASEEPAHPQMRTLVLLLENDFFEAFYKMLEEIKPFISEPSEEMLRKKFFKVLPDIFKKKWKPFKFISVLPEDDKPVILLGSILKQLSDEDRKILRHKKTITFGPVGITDERYNARKPFYAELAGLKQGRKKTVFYPMDLKKYFNNKAFSSKKRIVKADFDGEGNSISSTGFPGFNKGLELCEDNVKFILSERNGNDNIKCENQKIAVQPGSYTSANFLMASVRGDAVAKAELLYEEGYKEGINFGPAVSDWTTPPFFAEEGLVLTMENKYGKNGEDVYLSVVKIPLSPAKNLKSIILPDAPRVHVFAVSLGKNEDSKAIFCDVIMGEEKISGRTEWIATVNKGSYMTLATFGNGAPAVIQSKDKRHVAFLFDALTWRGIKDEISRDLKSLSIMLDNSMELLVGGD